MEKSRKSKKKAKEVGIKLWQYLADHPEIGGKYHIEDVALFKQVEQYDCLCPLCEFYNDSEGGRMTCAGCPLAAKYGPCSGNNPKANQHPYLIWDDPDPRGNLSDRAIENKRRKNALKILDVMKGWDVE